MRTSLQLAAGLALLGAVSVTARAASLSLASTMNGDSYIAESQATGGFSRINLGDGTIGDAGYISNPSNPNYANSGDRDGHYLWNGADNPATIASPTATGSGWDLFPRETAFQVGSLSYDEGLVSSTGVSVVPISSIDLSAFWASDPNRTNGTPGSGPTVVSDISDRAIGLWFFDGPGGIGFGALDAGDTLTFTDGALTSINLSLPASFSISAFGMDVTFNGTFSVTGSSIAYLIDDTQALPFFGPTRFLADITGTVNALAPVPEPASAALIAGGLMLGAVAARRRRRAA